MPVKQSMAVGLTILFNFVNTIIFVTAFPIMIQVMTISIETYTLAFVVFWAILVFIFDR